MQMCVFILSVCVCVLVCVNVRGVIGREIRKRKLKSYICCLPPFAGVSDSRINYKNLLHEKQTKSTRRTSSYLLLSR